MNPYRLYLITDRKGYESTTQMLYAIEQAIIGGVSIVQYREKNLTAREMFHEAKKLRELTLNYKIPLIINDRVDLAISVEADGVHVGQDDLPIESVRQMIGNKIIGISTHNIQEAIEAEKKGADYIGVGTIFPTNSKKDITKIIGIDGFNEITSSVSIPCVAIGGITHKHMSTIIKSGGVGVAVVSAILGEYDSKIAAERFDIR